MSVGQPLVGDAHAFHRCHPVTGAATPFGDNMTLVRLLTSMLLAVSCTSFAQGYPDKAKTLKLIVPFGAGSSTDLMARAYGRAMGEIAGINVIVDNKPGADGVIGVQAAKASAPDGYTMLLANSSTQVLNVHMQPKLPYDPVADFVPVSGVAKFSLVLNAGPGTTFKTVRELIEAARRDPGKLRYGSATASTRLSMEMLEHLAGVKMLSVPYKTMAAATLALASGEIDFLMNDASTAIPFYKSGQVRPLAVTGAARMVVLPDIQTLREQGLADYEFSGWFAMYFPAHTPTPVIAAMQGVLREAAKSKYVSDALALNAFEPLELTSLQLAALQGTESERWGKLLRAMGVQPR
jgi:tripartite-type tricarboxylate transporter receptor subunit TctC